MKLIAHFLITLHYSSLFPKFCLKRIFIKNKKIRCSEPNSKKKINSCGQFYVGIIPRINVIPVAFKRYYGNQKNTYYEITNKMRFNDRAQQTADAK